MRVGFLGGRKKLQIRRRVARLHHVIAGLDSEVSTHTHVFIKYTNMQIYAEINMGMCACTG